ncbi:DUF72 domain-containing protein [Maribacter sp. MMG018]|uniref:DUF72 domain-containing protein n=1 Tax=Maribacter sp. MMG018 TaxID=2822688 RepID=UPI001B378F87|nr:DUF72 domain-containing protein [Maribacter sp. MMG018]MBQ4915160.1 DUF72 domain-containing protein [Maribacter sp. MMG018]
MKFGKVERPELIDFSLPNDHKETKMVLDKIKSDAPLRVHVGCAKWNKQDLKNFYPKGTRDELRYYSTQFNCIELNATFYRIFPVETYQKWREKTPDNFTFFPKIVQNVSHLRRLNDQAYPILESYLTVTSNLEHKLGTIFLQMHNNFSPKDWDRVVRFIENWPKEFRLAIEFRHTDWFNDTVVAEELYHLLEENNVTNILVDTAGRRDIMHMRLTNNEAFIRFVGANHKSDYERLDDWVEKLSQWKENGLTNINFFVHQNMEVESPLLASYLIKKLNHRFICNLTVPTTLTAPPSLF